jgi:hypothetical protein
MENIYLPETVRVERSRDIDDLSTSLEANGHGPSQ